MIANNVPEIYDTLREVYDMGQVLLPDVRAFFMTPFSCSQPAHATIIKAMVSFYCMYEWGGWGRDLACIHERLTLCVGAWVADSGRRPHPQPVQTQGSIPPHTPRSQDGNFFRVNKLSRDRALEGSMTDPG